MMLNQNETYFTIGQTGKVHCLSNRIPFRWKELIVICSTSFVVMTGFLGLRVGLYNGILTFIGYMLYRWAAWMYYKEVMIDPSSGSIICSSKLMGHTFKEELITSTYDLSKFKYEALTRSGKTKFLLYYQTHKKHELLILKNKADKKFIKTYLETQLKDNMT